MTREVSDIYMDQVKEFVIFALLWVQMKQKQQQFLSMNIIFEVFARTFSQAHKILLSCFLSLTISSPSSLLPSVSSVTSLSDSKLNKWHKIILKPPLILLPDMVLSQCLSGTYIRINHVRTSITLIMVQEGS